MPSGAIEIVRASIDAFNRRDIPGLLDLIDPAVEWTPLRAVLDGDVYRGHTGVRRFIAHMDEDIDRARLRTDEVFEVGANVVVYGAIVGTGRGSRMDLEFPLGWVLRVRGGRVVYLRAYTERDAALKAARGAGSGLDEPLGPPARALDS